MKPGNRLLTILLFIGFIGIQLATLIDNPQHLIEPDPKCPICLAAQTQVCITAQVTISFTPDIILYLSEETTCNQGTEDTLSNIPIRAPPIS